MYRGWRSTKFHLSLISMAVVTYGYVGAGSPESLYGSFVMAVLGAAGIYAGARVTEKALVKPVAETEPEDSRKKKE